MEDNNIKTEENKIWEGSQKGTEQNNKESSQPTATETTSLETHPSTPTPPPPESPCPAPGAPPEPPCPAPGASGGPPPGGNNAKWAAVANGQPPATSSPPQRYMPREVPPRFRCQQDHKVLLKRGQPPLSCMLLGGGNGGEGTPPLSCGDGPESNTAGASDAGSGSGSSPPPLSTPAATTPTAASEPSSYANPNSGEGSGDQPCSVEADADKVIADPATAAAATTKPGEWPSVVEAALSVTPETDNHRAQSASCGDGCLQQPQQQQDNENEKEEMEEQERLLQEVFGGSEAAVEGEGGEPGSGVPSTLASSPSECPQSAGSTMWLSSSSQAENAESIEGTAQSQSPPAATPTTTVVVSKGSLPPPPENQESLLGISSTSGSSGEVSGANSNPNCNSSAWPALALDETRERATAAATAAAVVEANAPLSPSSPVSSTSDNALAASLPPAPPPTSLANQELQEQLSADGGGERLLSPWDNQGSEAKTGPNTGAAGVGVLGNDGDDMDSRIPGGAVENLSTTASSFSARSSASSSSSSSSSSSAAASWKSSPQQQPTIALPLIPSSNNPSNTGASRADSWGMGMGGVGSSGSSGGGGGVWGSTNEKGGLGQGQGQEQASEGWGAVLGGAGEGSYSGGMTHGVSQGGGWDMEVGGVGVGGDAGADTDALASAGHHCSSAGDSVTAGAGGGAGDGSGNNSCGGSVISGGGEDGSLSQDSHSSLTDASAVTSGDAAAADKAEDNQKGDREASAGVFTGQEESSSSSSGGGGEDSSASVSGDTLQHQDHDQAQGTASESGPQTPGSGGTAGPTAAIQNMLGRGDLDPRVLCNTGWGQTQIRQNVAWDLEAEEAAAGGNRGNRSSFRAAASRPSGYPGGAGGTDPDPVNASQRFGMGHMKDQGWHDVNPSRGGPPPPQDSPAQKTAMEGVHHQGRMTRDFSGRGDGGGYGGGMESQGKGWGSKDDSDWGGEAKRDERDGGAGEWGTFGEQGSSSSSGGAKGSSGWGDAAQEEKGTGGWKELSMGTGDWRQNQPGGNGGGSSWKDSKGSGGGDEGSWSNWDEGRPKKSWGSGGGGGGGGGGDVKPYQGWGAKPMTTNQPPVAMKGPNQQQQSQAPQPPQQQQLRSDPRAMQQEGRGRAGGTGPPAAPHHNQNQSSGSSGWTSGPIPQVAPASEPSGWEEPSPQSISRKMEIDDGTSAWGDPTCYNTKSVNLWDKNSNQGGQGQGGGGQPPPPKPMQPPPPSQQPAMGRPPGPPPPMNRDPNMGKAPSMWGVGRGPPDHSVDNGTSAWGKGPEASSSWGEPDDPGKGGGGWGGRSPNPIKSGSKTMQEGWGEMDSSMGTSRHASWEEEDEGSNMWNSSGPQGNSAPYGSGGWGHANKRGNNKGGMKGDSWMNPVNRQFSNMGMMDDDLQDKRMDGDKRGMSDYNGEMRKGRGGGGVFRTPGSKEVGAGEAGPYYDKMGGHGVFGGSGGMPPLRGMHPINTPQGLRAQVPPQFLSPQVPGSMLKQMPPPTGNLVGGIGGVPGGVFTPQLSPQHLAMLSGIHPHMQQILACQLLLQQQQQQQQLLQNQRKFPQPMRQQPDPQQLARIMAVLQQQRQQQQQQGVGGMGSVGSKMSPSHLGGAPSKHPIPEHLQHPGVLGGTLAELQAKAQGGYPGFGSAGGNLSGLELGAMVGAPGTVKDPVGPQSRFKWMMEGHNTAPSPPDPNMHKNGPLPTPGKPFGSTPYAQYDLLGGDGSGMASQVLSDGWQRSPGIGQGGPIIGTSTWPPEFQPGVPWKGIQSADPESDPYMTPGGVLTPHDPPNLSDTDHQLLRDDTGSNPALNTLLPSHGAWPYSASESPLPNAHSSAKYSEYKSSWPLEPIGHSKSWKTNRNSSQPSRPPPGLTNQKQGMASPWPTGGPRLARGGWGGGSSQDTRFESDSAWSDGTAPRGSCWLLLSNLTPQIDGSTLRTICMQHGPLLTFHLGLTQGSALIRYSTPQEAAKAQSALHMCVLGNTTILAEFVSEEDVARYFAHSQAVAAAGGAGGAAGSGVGVGVTVAGGMGVAPGSTAPGTPGSSGVVVGAGAVAGGGGAGARKPGGERERGRGSLPGGGGSSNGAEAGVVGSGGAGPATPGGWQSLDVAGSPLDVSSPQGSGLGIFAQWSTNGAGEGEGDGVGIGAGTGVVVEPGRGGLWGGRDPWVPQQ
ncbi:trinucleotide repeat-containing gene 6B protein-like [Engraulis encrasicolus]|uniref:trinucleotide repeat-containing gene 6B protein-like n=1 Tax=Engraulis encrasicolus TaxID=184585 RepID=UPI002FCF9202